MHVQPSLANAVLVCNHSAYLVSSVHRSPCSLPKCRRRDVELWERCPQIPQRRPSRRTRLLYPTKWSNVPPLSPAKITGWCQRKGTSAWS